MADDVNLVVARARITGGVQLHLEAPERINGTPGARLLVKFPYRYEEVSRNVDGFRVQLTSEFGGTAAEPATLEHRDRQGLADDTRGFIVQEYVLPTSGEHTLSWRAAVEYRDGEDRTTDDLSGTVQVLVAGAPAPL